MPELSEHPTPRFQFGPLERRGLVLGLRAGQVACLLAAALLAVSCLRALPAAAGGGLAALLVLGGVCAAFLPVGGRSLDEWAAPLARYGWRRLRGLQRFHSGANLIGHLVTITERGEVLGVLPPEDRPAGLRDLRILEVEAGTGAAVGLIKDVRRHTYAGVLQVRGRSFGVLDGAGQSASVAGWAQILAGYALERSVVSRLQWIERTLPEDSQQAARHFRERGAQDAPEAALQVYSDALSQSRAGLRHERLLALRIDARRSWRQVRQAGQGSLDRGAGSLLLRELAALAERLEEMGIAVERVLGPRAIAEVIRTAHEPDLRPRLRVIHPEPEDAGPHPANAWPFSSVEGLSHLRTGRALHATYHVREWPRVEVGPDFLAPLLLGATCLRTVSMTLEPVPAARAARELRRALTADVSDDQIREKGGWLPSFRQQREGENVLRAERELADGHASYRFSAYITVSAATSEELEGACAEVEQAASRSHLELEPLPAQQEVAFTYTLPLAEGLR